MAIGDCCRKNCKYREQALHAYQQGEPMPAVPDAFVKVGHVKQGSSCTSTQMHLACYEKIEKGLLREIRRNTSTMSDSELIKAMWDQSRTGKFDMIRRSSWCECKCGGSFYVCTGDNRQPVVLGTDTCSPCTPSTEKKKKNKVQTNASPIKFASYEELNVEDDEVDDDLRHYLWSPEDSVEHAVEDVSDQMPPVTECTISFPTLPDNLPALPPPRRVSHVRELKPIIDIRSRPDFTMITITGLSYEVLKRLRGRLIGRAGKNIKSIEDPYKTKITLDLFPTYLRAWIRCSTKENRDTSAVILEHRCVCGVQSFN